MLYFSLNIKEKRTRNPHSIAGENANWYSQRCLKKLRTELSYNPVIPIPKNLKTFIHRDVYNPMFIAVLFITAKTWEQLKCPSLDDWMERMRYIHTTLLSHKERRNTDT